MAKSEHPFDQKIKERLASFSVQKDPDWSFMQQKVKEAESDLDFDQKIKQALHNASVDSKEIQWEQFVAKRMRQQERQRKIIQARVIESILVLLLLWTLDNVGITNILPPHNQTSNLKSAVATTLNQKLHTESNVYLSKSKQQDFSVDNSSIVNNDSHPANKGFDRKKIKKNQSPVEFKHSKKLEKPILQSGVNSVASTSNSANETISPTTISKEKVNALNTLDRNTGHEVSPLTSLNQENINLEPIIILNGPVEFQNVENNLNDLPQTIETPEKIIKSSNGKSIYLNVHSGLLLNTIQSPSFFDNGAAYQYQLKPGFQSAISMSVRSNKWMIESGIVYQKITYSPNISETLGSFEFGYYKILFSKIEAQFISLPILLHRSLIQSRNWSIGIKAGLSISASLKNNFQLDTFKNISGRNNPSLTFGNDQSLLASRVRDISNQGLLDGGNFGTNSFANLNIGLRFQHSLSKFVQIYTDFELTKMLGEIGFGPNGDRFISSNFNTGIAIKL